jgi:hypothetical protein
MIEYVSREIPGKDLKLGFRGEFVYFRHRKFEDRPTDHQEDYFNLNLSISAVGIKKPLIVFDNHVLIGMRRYEIAMDLNPDCIFDCVVILENVKSEWTRFDIPRLDELKEHIGEIEY